MNQERYLNPFAEGIEESYWDKGFNNSLKDLQFNQYSIEHSVENMSKASFENDLTTQKRSILQKSKLTPLHTA
jgi:hypothetical protein